MDIENFPSLNKAEFAEACHHLESRYCRATLGPLRKRWKLRTCSALDVTSFDGGMATYVQIIRPLESSSENDDLALDLDKFTFTENANDDILLTGDDRMVDAEESDEVCVFFSSSWLSWVF
jgi:ubiquitin-like-conjugating enzyme ATG10